MDKNFLFDLITPSKNLISGDFDMVVVPGEEGDFGILPNHSNLISQIRPGVLNTYKNNKIDKSFFIYSGFAEFSNNQLIVLSETAFDVNDFKLNNYKDSISEYEKLKNQTKVESEIIFFEKKIEEANTIIEILK
ncbi:MAG: ATP synthase epsilon chain [Alphaproteobacteria bacterium MarineAlpha6_Bin4]|nr:MAG: ATP synthase epsilon chain [Alphaproteobacteria bacterium MarineAlpha6_Bin4]|tara:strand:- start:1779 stop:2180 length:402 start_codon:yes stop_codon:yes gene_type:complete